MCEKEKSCDTSAVEQNRKRFKVFNLKIKVWYITKKEYISMGTLKDNFAC